MSAHTLQLVIVLTVLSFTGNNMNRPDKEKQHYYCEYCGKKFPSIQVMTGGQCVNHPKGTNKGPHAPAL